VIDTLPRVSDRSRDVLALQVRHLIENLVKTEPGRQEIENVDDTDPDASNTRPSAALTRIDSHTPIFAIHVGSLAQVRAEVTFFKPTSAVTNGRKPKAVGDWVDRMVRLSFMVPTQASFSNPIECVPSTRDIGSGLVFFGKS
jgi:hypothetical protein